ncbi:hypothetical protein lerEdw1_013922 [Lerista edwardsae]|nr:hypothetical protein lerEdw1_013922 [Lerista edwardsae]
MATLVLDNGAYNAKIGYSHAHVSVIPNCQFRSKTARLKTFTANQLDEIKDPSGLFYILPFQKGYLVNWDVQRQVWDYLFGKEMYQVDFVDTNIIITEPYFNFSSIQESMNEILFEEYQFQAVLRVNAGALSAHRQLHVMDETHVINQVKEDVCYVSQDFFKDMEIAKLKGEENTVMLDYVLPDFSTIKKGFCKPREEMVLSGKYKTGEQILRLTNERFAVPEIVFHPSDIGIQEMGIPEAIVYSIQNLPEEMQPHFFKNIVLTGGNTLFPGFRDRVYSEVRCLTPTDYDVSVVLPEKLDFESSFLIGKHTAIAMESMLNKLKSTVTKVTADVTSAVMGNPVTREFDVGRHIASGGNGLAWKIFNGTKKSTKQEVAVFVFDKKVMDKYQKFEKDQIIDSLKRGVQQLTRLRHPRLLTVQHPLEESRDCLAFCTEPVCASLANVLGSWDNLPSPLPSDIKEYKLYDVETKYGLLQVSEGLSFLHSSVKMVHGNLSSENIILNKSGAWKIMGFDFCIQSLNPSEQELSRLGSNNLKNIPEEVREHVKLLLNVAPAVRPDADQITKIPFFDDVGAVTLQYFDSLFQRDNLQKSQFFKGLPKVLPKLPKRVIVQRILPCLTSEFVNPDMVPFVLPNVLLIAEECTKEEYIRLILPDLSPVFKQQEPIQILLIFLQKMDLLLTKTPPDEIKNSVLPMVYRALEAPSTQIQVRVNSLVCLGKILEYLDKWFVLDDILPFLQQIPSKEPAVLMGILGIYKCTFSHKKLGITKEQLAGKVLPHLIPLSIENNLNLNQFNSFISVIKEMLSRLEVEHKTKLEQIHVMQEQQK